MGTPGRDHDCCEAQPNATAKTCGKRIRGLLHTRCNSAVGIVETMGEMVTGYLAEYKAARAA